MWHSLHQEVPAAQRCIHCQGVTFGQFLFPSNIARYEKRLQKLLKFMLGIVAFFYNGSFLGPLLGITILAQDFTLSTSPLKEKLALLNNSAFFLFLFLKIYVLNSLD